MTQSKKAFWLSLIFIPLLVIGTFWPATHFQFLNFDDNVYVTENAHVLSGLSFENLYWAFTQHHGGHWHPLTWLSHQLDCQLFGADASRHHLVNILFHAANAALLFLLLYRLFGDLVSATLMAALFAIHPLRLESVVWITERKDVLSLFFGLLFLNSYLTFRKTKSTPLYLLSFFCLTLGLLSKPSLVVLPLLIMLFDFWTLQNLRQKKYASLLEKFPFLLLGFVFSLTTLWAQSREGAVLTMGQLSFSERLGNGLVHYVLYFGKTFWPNPLSVFYPLVHESFISVVLAGLFLLLVSGIVWWQRSEKPYLLFGWLWFLIALLPIVGFIQVGGQSVADRWTHLPHVGLAIALCGAFSASSRKNHIVAFVIPLLLLSFYKTRVELPRWETSETLFTHALEVTDKNYLAHTNLGYELKKRGKIAEATKHFEEALAINPTYVEALNNLGGIRAGEGRWDEAISLFERAVARNPDDVTSRYNRALAYYSIGKKNLAIREWILIHQSSPDYKPAKDSLSFARSHDLKGVCPQSELLDLLRCVEKVPGTSTTH